MALNIDIITREAKGSPLTVSELDLNFENLRTGALDAYSHAEEVIGGNIDWSEVNFSLDGWITTKDQTALLIDLDVDETTYDVDIAASLGTGKSLSLGSGNASSVIKAKNSLEVDSTQSSDGLNLLDLKVNASSMFSIDKSGVLFLNETTAQSSIANGAFWFDGTALQLGVNQ